MAMVVPKFSSFRASLIHLSSNMVLSLSSLPPPISYHRISVENQLWWVNIKWQESEREERNHEKFKTLMETKWNIEGEFYWGGEAKMWEYPKIFHHFVCRPNYNNVHCYIVCVCVCVCVFPVVLYGCETWSLTLKEESRLRVFENRIMRRVSSKL